MKNVSSSAKKLPRLSLREIFYSFSRAFFFRLFSLLVENYRIGDSLVLYSTHISIYIYIYFFLVAQKSSFSHHAGARKERLFVCCFWTSSIKSLVGRFVFCCRRRRVNDRLKFRAIIVYMMDIFNAIRSAVLSLSLSISARVACKSLLSREWY